MRPRLIRKQIVTVRPLEPQSGDNFGDAPILVSQTRQSGFQLKMQITHAFGLNFEPEGPGGRTRDVRITALIRKRDVPHNAPEGWSPNTNDLFELADGYTLFLQDVQPAYPRRVSVRTPRGGYDGWRVDLTDRTPTMSPASEYE